MNQTISITAQLQYGARAFMLDLYEQSKGGRNEIICSHGDPIGGQTYTTFRAILTEIVQFIQSRPAEVIPIVLLLEDYVSNFHLVDQELAATGLYLRVKADEVARNGWPNIAASGIMAFAQNHRPPAGSNIGVPNMYDLCVETVYGNDSTNHNTWNSARQESNPIDGAAKEAGLSVDNTLSIVNHFPTNPLWLSSDYAGNYNSKEVLNSHLDTFIWNNNRIPNFFSINFVNIGDGLSMLTRWSQLNEDFRYPHWMPWVDPKDLNFAEENMIVVPNGQYITAIDGLNQPGRGIVNLRVWTGSATEAGSPAKPKVSYSDHNLGSNWMTPEFDGQQNSDVLTLSVPAGSRFGAMIGCLMNGYGIVNIVVPGASRPDGTPQILTGNESLNADRVGPDGRGTSIFHENDNMRAFHIRYDSRKGVRDMRYAYE